MGMCCSGVEFSHLLTNHICSPNVRLQLLFSASSFYPGREVDVPLARLSDVILDIDQFSDTNGGGTDVDSESDWRTELQPSGPRLSSAAALEVRL
jgi:hypothetical protein